MMRALPTDVRSEARAWVMRMADDVGPADHDAFRRWCEAAPAHAAAYQRELDRYHALAPLEARFADELAEIRERRPARRFLLVHVGLALAASLALFLVVPRVLVGTPDPARNWSAPVATAVAEVRAVALSDGSVVTLGARTQFQSAFTPGERRIRLAGGEAFFNVAPDRERPFLVETQDTTVRVVGTAFEVKAAPDGVRVTVASGVVEVTEPGGPAGSGATPRRHRLTAGQQLSLLSDRQDGEARANPAPAQLAAWRDGFLVYEDASLAEVVADANRYSTTPIRLLDPALGRLRVTTAYRTDQVDQMLSIVGASLPIEVQRAPGEVRLVAKP